MADENESWNKLRGKLRRALDLDPLCQEESEKEYKKIKPVGSLPESDIDAIMQYVRSFGESGGVKAEAEGEEDEPASEWTEPVNAEDMDAELMDLVNRNRGRQDEETDELLKKHREKELGDAERDGEEGDADDGKNTP